MPLNNIFDMKKGLSTVLAFAFAVLFLGACNNRNLNHFSEKVIGKWMAADRNGSPLLTNMSHVVTFVSPTEGYTTTSWIELVDNEDNPLWKKRGGSEVVIKGHKITKTLQINDRVTVVDKMKVTSITDDEMCGVSEIKTYMDGLKVATAKYTCRYIKISDNFEQAILGVWEGRVTSEEGSDFGDSQLHRWEFRTDGNYRYYVLSDGQWAVNDEFAQYFIDGNMLCCRWKNLGESQEEHREWWVITSIENGVMEWSAVRESTDGITYTATVKMSKIK